MSVLREEFPKLGMESLCELFGYSRQAYYQYVTENEFRDNAITPLIFDAVRNYRKDAPRMGIIKLHYLISNLFKDEQVPGRDAFFNLMRENGFVLRKRKTRKTTNSRHHFRKFENLIIGFDPTAPNQLWVSDITYLETADGTCYLSLVTDACSHKIVGWAVGETLEALHPVTALRMALDGLNGKIPSGLIHHSDRGVQYCCNQYVQILQENKMQAFTFLFSIGICFLLCMGVILLVNQKLQGELTEISKELKNSNVNKDKFFSILAHDLRGPLATIESMIDLMTDVKYDIEIKQHQAMALAIKKNSSFHQHPAGQPVGLGQHAKWLENHSTH